MEHLIVINGDFATFCREGWRRGSSQITLGFLVYVGLLCLSPNCPCVIRACVHLQHCIMANRADLVRFMKIAAAHRESELSKLGDGKGR